MSTFICHCGKTFKTKEMADLHVKIHESDMDGLKHQIFKQHWKARFATWLFSLPGKRLSHFMGAYIIYSVLIHHFHIDWSWCEAMLIGVGMGLYIE